MLSVAVPHWQIVFVKPASGPTITVVRGPETTTSVAGIPQDAQFLGIEFKLGAFMPTLALEKLVDVGKVLNAASKTHFNLFGKNWEVPDFENAFDFVAHLVRDGALVRDTEVQDPLRRMPVSITERSVQRRFLRATGLTYATVRQIERVERTVALFSGGASILDAVEMAGYSDQAHMTRSLQRFVGRTPGQLVLRQP